ncbi:MAG: LysR family transcriptional regulator [Cellvibrionaceae bacterium]
MNIKNLEAFLAIVQLGSFKAASEKLHTTQPAISARIANLENEIGSSIFDRSDKKAHLTPKGYKLLPYAEKVIALLQEMRFAVGDKEDYSGTVRLGSSETIVHIWVSEFIHSLHEEYPNLTIELIVDTSINLREKLLKREIDLAFLMGPLVNPDLESKFLCKYPLSWVASPKLKLPDRILSLADLTKHQIITYQRQTRPYVQLKEMFNLVDLPMVKINGLSSMSTIIRMAVDGIGISTLPPAAIQNELSAGTLVELKTEQELGDLMFIVVHSTDPLVRTIADIAQKSGKIHSQ